MEKLINEFSFGLFFWQLLIFVGLILILKKFAWKPILDTLNEREKSIKDSLESAQKAKDEFSKIKSDNERILNDAKKERDFIISDAKKTGREIVDDAKNVAKIESEKTNIIDFRIISSFCLYNINCKCKFIWSRNLLHHERWRQ